MKSLKKNKVATQMIYNAVKLSEYDKCLVLQGEPWRLSGPLLYIAWSMEY